MLASELAHELGIDPTVMSKQLNTYYQETDAEKTRPLSDQTIKHVRAAHDLLRRRKAGTFREAVLMAVGRYDVPLDPEQVHRVHLRLTAIEANLQELTTMVTSMAEYMRTRAGRQEQSTSRAGGLPGAVQDPVTGQDGGAD